MGPTHSAVPSHRDWGQAHSRSCKVHGDEASLMSRRDKSYSNEEM